MNRIPRLNYKNYLSISFKIFILEEFRFNIDGINFSSIIMRLSPSLEDSVSECRKFLATNPRPAGVVVLANFVNSFIQPQIISTK